MATPTLDVSVLSYFTPVFIFLAVWVMFYAVLQKTQILGKNQGLSALLSFCIAFLFIITATASKLVEILLPWLGILVVIAMAAILLFMFMGVSGETIAKTIGGNAWTIVIVLIILLVIALTQVFGPSIKELTQESAEEGDFMKSIGSILFHPSILGMFLILVIASLAVKWLTQ